MSINTIDTRKKDCPQPVIMTKKAISAAKGEQEFLILLDNEIAKENVSRFLRKNKIEFKLDKVGNEYQISFYTGEIPAKESCLVSKQNVQNTKGHVIAISSDKMGSGSDELGSLLIQGFINTVKEVAPLPEKIIFYNSGVKLTIESSPVAVSLKELEARGINIIICGTCADYFEIKDQINTGTISNMYDILESLTEAKHIIKP